MILVSILIGMLGTVIGYTINNKARLRVEQEKNALLKEKADLEFKIAMKDEYMKEIEKAADLYEGKSKIIELAKTGIKY